MEDEKLEFISIHKNNIRYKYEYEYKFENENIFSNEEGYGYGHGIGHGDGDGFGNGYGGGHINEIENKVIYFLNDVPVILLDGIETILLKVRKDYAVGYIVNRDMSLTKCHIVKNEKYHSHGISLKEAIQNLKPIDKKLH